MDKKEATMLVTLNSTKYKQDDLDYLNDSNFEWVSVENNKEHWPSAIGWDAIVVAVSFASGAILDGVLSELGSDIYNWFKNKLFPVIIDKGDFDESRISIQFDDLDVTIYFNRKDDLIFVFENLEKIIRYHRSVNPNSTVLSISIYEGNRDRYGETH